MPLSSDFATGLNDIIRQLGSAMTITDTGGGARTVRGALTTIGKEDAELVNALGIDARIIYTQALTPRPEKFHRFTITTTGEVFVIHTVHNILVDDRVIGHKFAVKG